MFGSFFRRRSLIFVSTVVLVLSPIIPAMSALPTDAILWQYGTTGVVGAEDNQLSRPHGAEYLPASETTLIADTGNHRVIEVDKNGNIVWQYGTTGVPGNDENELDTPDDAKRLEGGNTLIADRGNSRVIEVDEAGNIVWQYGGHGFGIGVDQLKKPYEAERLPAAEGDVRGNTLIADRDNHRVIEVRSDDYDPGQPDNNFGYTADSIVWQYGTGVWGSGVNRLNGAADADRLANDNTLIVDYWNNRVIEVKTSDYKAGQPPDFGFTEASIVWQYGTTGVNGSGRNQLNIPLDAEQLPDGNILISDTNFDDNLNDGIVPNSNDRVIEVTHDGAKTIVWQYGTGATGSWDNRLNHPYSAQRLADLTTLIADRLNHRVIRVGQTDTPSTTLTTNPASPDGSNGWFKTVPMMTLTPDAAVTTHYSWGSPVGPWTAYSDPFPAPTGENIFYYTSEGELLIQSAFLKVDLDAPISSIASPSSGVVLKGSNVSISGTASDAPSGLAKVEISADGGSTWKLAEGTTSWSYTWALPADGSYNIKSKATDTAGNVEIPGAGVNVTVDNTAPTVTSTSPADPATDVTVSTNVMATFSEDMDASTITGSTFTLSNGGSVAGVVTYDIPSKTATFNPTGDLAYSTTYTATVTTGAKDLAGNGLSVNKVWTFTTAAAPDTTPPTTTLATTPASPDGTGGWFKTVPSITLTPNETATTYYSWISASGPWDTYSSAITAPLGQNTLYYYSQDAAGNPETPKSQLFKVDTSIPSSTITAPSAGATLKGANYVITGTSSDTYSGLSKVEVSINGGGWNLATGTTNWSYSWTLPPDGSYNIKSRATDSAGNVETPSAGVNVTVDNTAPTVTSTSPADPATDVTVSTNVMATFSEGVDATTINVDNFTLYQGTTPVTGAVSYDAVNKTATFNPDTDFSYSTTYMATVTTGVEDLAGNNMASNKVWSFTTGASPSGGGGGGGGGAGGTATSTTSATEGADLSGYGTIAGRVVNTAWQVVPSASVRVGDIPVTFDIRDGRFIAGMIPVGIYTVHYDARGYSYQSQVIEIGANQTTQAPTCLLSPVKEVAGVTVGTGEILGRVVNQAWKTIPGTCIRIDNTVIPTNPGGQFRFTLVSPGIYTIHYDAPGYRGQTQLIEVKAGGVTEPPTVIMDPGITPSTQGEIYGRVVNQAHQPIPLAAVRIDNAVIPTNAFGEFRFHLVNPGIYTIYYDAYGFVRQTQVVEVKAGMITLPPTVIMSM